jgi:hypothetical protein
MNKSTQSHHVEGEFDVITSTFDCGCILSYHYKPGPQGELVKVKPLSICSQGHRTIIEKDS